MTASCRLQTLLAAGHFVLSAELTPPRHHNLRPLMAIASKLTPYLDVIQINDNALAQARLSNIVAAQFVWHAGIEPIVQMTLRHRNRIALQSDLLGLAALGIRNLMIVGGYPCSMGSDPEAKDAQDMKTIDAIAAINNLTERGYMFNGEKIMLAPDLFLGTVAYTEVKPQALDASLDNLEAKINCGAKFVQLQASFDLESIQRWMAEVVKRGLHRKAYFLAALYPFKCEKELILLSRLAGVNIPKWLFTQVRQDKSASFDFNLELTTGIQAIEGIRGLHFRSIHARNCIPQLVTSARLRESYRPVA
jgi:methylenetetrahydrofolate reductase (NADPH)